MPTEVFNSRRSFQIWKYTVGHSQLLLRSTKSPDFPTRIDVFFKGVKEIHLPTSFTGLSITEASQADIQKLCILQTHPSMGSDLKYLQIQGVGFLGYVMALIVVWHEDSGEYDEPSFFAKDNIL